MQLLVFRCRDDADPAELTRAAGQALSSQRVGAVVYEDINDPRGIAVLTLGGGPRLLRPDRPPGASTATSSGPWS